MMRYFIQRKVFYLSIVTGLLFIVPMQNRSSEETQQSADIQIINYDEGEAETWRLSNITFSSVAYNDTTYVAVGNNGVVFTASDGVTWRSQYSTTKEHLFHIVHGNGRFVAVGKGGVIVSSLDGFTWEKIETRYYIDLYTITWTGEQFIAGGKDTILKSKDGKKWVRYTLSNWNKTIFSIAGTKDSAVALAECGNKLITTNSTKWKRIRSKCGADKNLTQIIWDGSRYVAIGEKGAIRISKDGETWTNHDLKSDVYLKNLVWTGEYYYLMDGEKLLRSSDALDWEVRSVGDFKGIFSLIFNDGKLIAVGTGNDIRLFDEETSKWNSTLRNPMLRFSHIFWFKDKYLAVGPMPGVFESQDGIHWSKKTIPLDANLKQVVSNGKVFVAIANNGVLIVSKDGKDWLALNTFAGIDFIFIKWLDGQFFAMQRNGIAVLSSDGYSWKKLGISTSINTHPAYMDFDGAWNSIAGNSESYLAVGDNGRVAFSLDKTNWAKLSLKWKEDLYDGVWVDEYFVVSGNDNTLLFSEDRMQWRPYIEDFPYTLVKMVYKNGIILGLDKRGYLVRIDTENKTVIKIEQFNNIRSISKGGDFFYAVNENGDLLKTSDGNDWEIQHVYSGVKLNSVAEVGSTAVIVGNRGFVYRSENGKEWQQQNIEQIGWLIKIIRAQGGFMALSLRGALYYSVDGKNWEVRKSPASHYFLDIVWTGTKYLLVGQHGIIYSSKDAIEWTEHKKTYLYDTLVSVAMNKERIIVMGLAENMLISDDGETWKVKTQLREFMLKVYWCNERFIAIGRGNILTSVDGERWKKTKKVNGMGQDDFSKTMLYDIKCSSNTAVVVGGSGLVLLSSDNGENWEKVDVPTSALLSSVEYNGERFIISGNDYTILRSPRFE